MRTRETGREGEACVYLECFISSSGASSSDHIKSIVFKHILQRGEGSCADTEIFLRVSTLTTFF